MGNQSMILRGGPFDGTRFDDVDNTSDGLVELESEGLVNRNIPTTQVQEVDGEELAVYQFDGTVAIDGGMPGAEDPRNRLASPLADELRGEDKP